jgi:hypothetical protein
LVLGRRTEWEIGQTKEVYKKGLFGDVFRVSDQPGKR